MNQKSVLILLFSIIFISSSSIARAADGCGQGSCCCQYKDSLGRNQYTCALKDDCTETLNGTCGHMGKCSRSENKSDIDVLPKLKTEQRAQLPIQK